MNSNVIVVLLWMLFALMTGCVGEKEIEQHSTGYPNGELQQKYVFYDGNLYAHNGTRYIESDNGRYLMFSCCQEQVRIIKGGA